MGLKTVRLDEDSERILQDLLRETGLSTSAVLKRGLLALRDNAYAEFKDTSHDKNRTGVRAECADCHLPKEFVPMMVRKVEAAREVWGHITGYIDTPEKYEKARHAMAVREWTRMKKNDSQECRNCHTTAAMDPEKQSENARARHAKAKAEGTTCIDCHFGIAHTEPDGPGPREIKVSR